MKRLPATLLMLACSAGSAAALAQASQRYDPPAKSLDVKEAETPGRPRSERPRPSTLDDLFARLAAARDAEEAKGVAQLIERRLARSGSDTADLLMSRAGEALVAKDAALAVELLDRVTELKPDWAEAWNRRAAAFFVLDDPADALADLNKALKSEPRHFGAWLALGHILLASGDKHRALDAYRKALELHPFLEEAKKIVERLAPEFDGRDL